ncbi:hypothetical protein A3711_09015 [Erythrobacter sp. HI00D59]|nr:hypothetical protein A3711_09015 [Erythrobacter sp. HI00D59]
MTALSSIPILPDIQLKRTKRELATSYVCHSYDITKAELVGRSKARHLTTARALFVWLIRRHRPEVSYATLGNWLKRDHSTCIHLFRKAERLIQNDDEFGQECLRFELFLYQNGGREPPPQHLNGE